MGLKMPIQKKEDTVSFITMGTAAPSSPFLFGRALRGCKRTTQTMDSGSTGSVRTNLKGYGIPLGAESTLSGTPFYFGYQALCWDLEMSLTLPQSSPPFDFGKLRHNDWKPLLQGQKARRCWNLSLNPDSLAPGACPFLEGADICTELEG